MVVDTILIGICGKARAGKDTVADLLSECSDSYIKSPMAAPLKQGIKAMFGDLPSDEDKESLVPGFDFTWRRAMQTLGTEWGRDLDEEIWVKLQHQKLMRYQGTLELFVIPDIRFDNEAEWLLVNNGFLVEVSRDDVSEVETHASESGISFDPHFIIYNNEDIEYLETKAKKLWRYLRQ